MIELSTCIGITLFLGLIFLFPFLFAALTDQTIFDSLFVRKTEKEITRLSLEGDFSYVFQQKQFPIVVLSVICILLIWAFIKTSIVVYLVVTAILVIYYLIELKIKPIPHAIVTNNNLSVDGKTFNWDDIQRIEFTVASHTYIQASSKVPIMTRSMPRRAVVLLLQDFNEINIYLAAYRKGRLLRSLIEKIAVQKGIPTRTFDRGM